MMRATVSLFVIAGIAAGLAALPPRKAAKPGRTVDGRPEQPATADHDESSEGRNFETAIFAGGCFWCTEFAFEQLEGVLEVESGYCGGTRISANYDQVHLGVTAHAEAIRVYYDPAKISYDELLDVFFDSHDPTQLNRQGEDVGRQYRSAIFFASDEQKEHAEAKIADLEAKRVYRRKIKTKLDPLKTFYPAEAYHQNFARRNPNAPYIRGHAVPKAYHIRNAHPDLIRK